MTAEELAEKVDEIMEKVRRPLVIVEARATLNEAGIVAARRSLEASLSLIDGAQRQKRRCEEEERAAKEVADTALFESEWELDGHFTTTGNKTFLVEEWCEVCKGSGEGEGLAGSQCAPCKGNGYAKARPVLADDKARWKAAKAAEVPAVRKARTAHLAAQSATAEARDQVDLAERTFSARKWDLQGAIATVETLRLGLTERDSS